MSDQENLQNVNTLYKFVLDHIQYSTRQIVFQGITLLIKHLEDILESSKHLKQFKLLDVTGQQTE